MTSESESAAQKRPFDAIEDGPSAISEPTLDPSLESALDPALEATGSISPVTSVTPITPVSESKPKKKKKSSSQQRRLEPFREGKQASVAQIRDLRLLTRFVKDFELKIKQHEIDDYLGFSSRTSRRLRNGGPTKSELVAEGKLERHPRADNWKNGKEKKRKAAMEAETHDIDLNDSPTVDPQLENPIHIDTADFANSGYRDSYDLMTATGGPASVQGIS